VKFALLTGTVILGLVTPAKAVDPIEFATNLIGMSAFVSSSCVGLEPNYPMVRVLLDREGIEMETVKTPQFIKGASAVAFAMTIDTKKKCIMVFRDFGPEGQVQPNLVLMTQ
jgi:hypothetical protein